jgi:hypothetical protein
MLLLFGCITLKAQEKAPIRCGSMEVMENTFKRNPALRVSFETQNQNILKILRQKKAQVQTLRTEGAITYVPVVFHIVLTDPSIVTDAQLQAQIDRLNIDYAGLNADSTEIPAAFKPLFAKTHIQFKLAQRTPDDQPSNGITRTVTTHSSYTITDNSVKYTSLGGADAWDHNRFFNVWITDLSGNYLGYSTFPGSGPAAEDGVVINHIGLPGGQAPYNVGRTLTHETGHYFFLYHIWGDDNGACTGTDYIDDTPNQGNFTSGCPGGAVRTDNCTTTAPGIMYENFMDYTDDACMVMFTTEQVDRMETSLSQYRSSLFTSNGADPVVLYSLDASAKSISTPLQRVCTSTFSPVFTLRNKGSKTLTSAAIYASVDNGTVSSTTNWTGSLATMSETSVTLNAMTITQGTHILKIVVSSPNGNTDEDASNDTITTAFQYYEPMAPPVTEGFEKSTFPPAGWDIVNPDASITWERVTGVSKSGNASVMIRNFDYKLNGQKDYLRLPTVNITNADSAFMTFQVAAAVTTDPSSTTNAFDTLEVLASKDCGLTYTSLYKKWGGSLITRSKAYDSSFVPKSTEWRKDSVNLTPYINAGSLVLAFVNTTEFENNIYLDDINVYSVNISANLKEKGFMITPNPTTGMIAVQFYPNPPYVKGINIFSIPGQKVASQIVNGPGSSAYYFDLGRFASGVYVVQIVLGDKVITRKVIKK